MSNGEDPRRTDPPDVNYRLWILVTAGAAAMIGILIVVVFVAIGSDDTSLDGGFVTVAGRELGVKTAPVVVTEFADFQ